MQSAYYLGLYQCHPSGLKQLVMVSRADGSILMYICGLCIRIDRAICWGNWVGGICDTHNFSLFCRFHWCGSKVPCDQHGSKVTITIPCIERTDGSMLICICVQNGSCNLFEKNQLCGLYDTRVFHGSRNLHGFFDYSSKVSYDWHDYGSDCHIISCTVYRATSALLCRSNVVLKSSSKVFS